MPILQISNINDFWCKKVFFLPECRRFGLKKSGLGNLKFKFLIKSFRKMQILQLSNINAFVLYKSYLSIKNVVKHFLWSIWPKRVKLKKFQIFDQTIDLKPFGIKQNLQISNISNFLAQLSNINAFVL